jgi:hypothetical protein
MSAPKPKFEQALKRLPPALAVPYQQLVDDYAFRSEVRIGRRFVAYDLLADLILMGWRPTGPDLLTSHEHGT